MQARLRQPIFGRYGNKVVGGFCAWELVAFIPGSPVPTISETVKRHPVFGVTLLGLLAHHWYVEAADLVEQILDS